MLWACRSTDSMRGARIQDATIRRLLEKEGLEGWIIDDALAWQGDNPPMEPAYQPLTGAAEPSVPPSPTQPPSRSASTRETR